MEAILLSMGSSSSPLNAAKEFLTLRPLWIASLKFAFDHFFTLLMFSFFFSS